MANESGILTVGELREFLAMHSVSDDAQIGIEIFPGSHEGHIPDEWDVGTAGFEIVTSGFERLVFRNKS